MSYLDKIDLPFKRREYHDETIARISTDIVSLDSTKEVLPFAPDTKKPLMLRKESSFYSKQLLNDILPEVPQKNHLPLRSNSAKHKKFPLLLKAPTNFLPKKKEIKIPCMNIFEKKCDSKKHLKHKKFILNFLTPINEFISKDFSLSIDKHEEIGGKLKNKKMVKCFFPPKIPILKI